MPISAANRKTCFKCGADVTFARRASDPKGRYLCLDCAKALEISRIATPQSAPLTTSEPEDNLRLLAQPMPAKPTGSTVNAVEKPRPVQAKTKNPPLPRSKEPFLWIGGGVAVVLALVVGFVMVNRKSWDQLNHDQILSMKADADGLLRSGQPKAAYDHYRDLFAFVGEHEIQNDSIKDELNSAKSGMESARSMAAPLIAKEEEEARQRAAERQRLADERRAAELAQQQKVEAERQQQEVARAKAETDARERDRIARDAAAQRAMKETAIAVFLKSDEFGELKRKADSMATELNTDLIGEDSVYRGLSKRSKASRNLLGLYVKAQGHLLGKNVDVAVDRVLSDANTDLNTEDSAIRAIYENDKAFFQVLGPWCSVMDGKNGSLQGAFDTQSQAATLSGIGDDSAIRAIDSYSDASMQVLRAIVSAQGLGAKADAIISKAQTENIGDDSAWRVAMHNEEGNMRLLLLMVAQQDPATAAKIGSEADTAMIGDDSVLRAQEAYHQGKVDALHWLVSHP